MFGNNVKVHFAGCESIQKSIECRFAGVNYALFSVYRFINRQFEKNGGRSRQAGEERCSVLFKQLREFRHVIMDSGLFTLMFGAASGKRDEKFITAWTEALCKFVHENDIRATCVEVDCQKVLGVKQAWRMRERMKKLMPDRQIINVFHKEDGQKGLDRLIEYSDYIAISVPELRRLYGYGAPHIDAVVRLANYVKHRKPSIDIHLLGCTDVKLLRKCSFCTSADSTSWFAMTAWGHVPLAGKQRWLYQIKDEVLDRLRDELTTYFARYGIKIGKLGNRVGNVIAAKYCLRDYEIAAGDQS